MHKNRVAIDLSRGQRLREVRKWCQVTQAELAALVGVTKGTINHYENGRTHIMQERLEQLARAMRVPVAMLLRPPGATLPRRPPTAHQRAAREARMKAFGFRRTDNRK